MKSPITKTSHFLYILFKVLSIGVLMGPLSFYSVGAFISATTTVQKVTLTTMLMCSLLLTIINIILKLRLRSIIWIIFIGLYICLDSLMPLILMIAAATILDEFVFSPLAHKYKEKYHINREIDRRQ